MGKSKFSCFSKTDRYDTREGGFTRTMSDREAGRGYTGVPFTLFSL